jgi:hypothetical protein
MAEAVTDSARTVRLFVRDRVARHRQPRLEIRRWYTVGKVFGHLTEGVRNVTTAGRLQRQRPDTPIGASGRLIS